jgi:hypothetical protein
MLNWAGNREYTTGSVEHPTSVEDVQRVVRTGGTLKALGTRHSFNAIGDTAGRLVATTTLEYYLSRAEEYIGSPMLSSMYGVWAAWTGGRDLAAKLFDAGYAQFTSDRFVQTLEYRPDKFPDQPPAGPFGRRRAGRGGRGVARRLESHRGGSRVGPGPARSPDRTTRRRTCPDRGRWARTLG